jgi:hypothetical protein
MDIRVPLLAADAGGIRHDWIDHQDGSYTIQSVQDVETQLDLNKAMATHNDGYSPSRELRRAAHIPNIVVLKWWMEEGWNALDPRHWDRLRAKLNDPDWRHLRTAPGRL